LTDVEKLIGGRCDQSRHSYVIIHFVSLPPPDRAVQSHSPPLLFIADVWESVTTQAMSFHKLIIEFFCFPDVFANVDKFDLGPMTSDRMISGFAFPQ
jgi:hypothetical protein